MKSTMSRPLPCQRLAGRPFQAARPVPHLRRAVQAAAAVEEVVVAPTPAAPVKRK